MDTPKPAGEPRIDAALLQLASEGLPLTHDDVARLSGLSRRTVYRRYADQPRLRRRVWEILSPPSGMPSDLDDLLDHQLRETFERFDSMAPAMQVATASPEGRQMRLENKAERVAAYERIFGPRTAALTPEQRRRVHGAMQVLCSGMAWREMRDQWDLDGSAAAEASIWALKVLLAHLEREGADAFDV